MFCGWFSQADHCVFFHSWTYYLTGIFPSFFIASTDHLFGYFIISICFLAFFIGYQRNICLLQGILDFPYEVTNMKLQKEEIQWVWKYWSLKANQNNELFIKDISLGKNSKGEKVELITPTERESKRERNWETEREHAPCTGLCCAMLGQPQHLRPTKTLLPDSLSSSHLKRNFSEIPSYHLQPQSWKSLLFLFYIFNMIVLKYMILGEKTTKSLATEEYFVLRVNACISHGEQFIYKWLNLHQCPGSPWAYAGTSPCLVEVTLKISSCFKILVKNLKNLNSLNKGLHQERRKELDKFKYVKNNANIIPYSVYQEQNFGKGEYSLSWEIQRQLRCTNYPRAGFLNWGPRKECTCSINLDRKIHPCFNQSPTEV